MDVPRFDMEGRIISTLHPDFRLFNIYFRTASAGRTASILSWISTLIS